MVNFRHVTPLPKMVVRAIIPGRPLPKNTAVFRVPLDVNKVQIKHYFESLYGVKVRSVRTAVYNGKVRMRRVNNRKILKRQDADWKKAWVSTVDDFKPITISVAATK